MVTAAVPRVGGRTFNHSKCLKARAPCGSSWTGRTSRCEGCRRRPRGTGAGRGSTSSVLSTRSPRRGRCLCGGRRPEPVERLVPAKQLDALEEPRRDFRARDRDPYGLEGLPRLQAEPVGGSAKRGLDRLGRERLERRERGGRGLEHRAAAVQLGCVRRDVVEEEACKRRELAEALDL